MSNMPGTSFAREYIKRDSQMWWRPGRLYRPVQAMAGYILATGTPNTIVSAGNGTSTIQAENSTVITGLHMAATANTIADFIEIPYDMDLSKHIYFSAVWCASGTSGSCQWVFDYTPYTVGTTALTAPATALDFVVANQTTNASAYVVTRSPEGFINPGKLSHKAEYLGILLTDTLTTLTSVELLGYTIRYTPRRLYYDGMMVEAKSPTFIASNNYPNT